MLLLRPEDLSDEGTGSRPGVILWQRKRTPSSPAQTVLAWEDLLLVAPQVRFPEGCLPRSERTWREGVRAVWVPRLCRFLYLSPVPVVDLVPAEDLGPAAGEAVVFRCGDRRRAPLELVAEERVVGRLRRESAVRLELALGGKVRFRAAELCGRAALLGWKDGCLRAVVAVLP